MLPSAVSWWPSFFWAGLVGCVWYMLVILTQETISAGFTPNSRLGRRLISSIGVPRNSLHLIGVLISGAMKLALFGLAAVLVLAPWGLQSSDVSIDFRAALFGFKVGDTTIYPISIFIAAGIFALALAALHAVLNWTDSTLLPRMNCDIGLRNSIRTSLSYVGFVIAAGLAFSYLGVNFEKLALFGLQSIVNNFVSGLILLWERTVRVGDWIVVGSDQGFVRRISVRATEIETFDRSQVIIPNASLVAGVVTNLVRNDRSGRSNFGSFGGP
jgi:potassium-dependent mechanosensitive channel